MNTTIGCIQGHMHILTWERLHWTNEFQSRTVEQTVEFYREWPLEERCLASSSSVGELKYLHPNLLANRISIFALCSDASLDPVTSSPRVHLLKSADSLRTRNQFPHVQAGVRQFFIALADRYRLLLTACLSDLWSASLMDDTWSNWRRADQEM